MRIKMTQNQRQGDKKWKYEHVKTVEDYSNIFTDLSYVRIVEF
jgi:hypothetical protein